MNNLKDINVFEFLKIQKDTLQRKENKKTKTSFRINNKIDDSSFLSNETDNYSNENESNRSSSADYFRSRSFVSSNSNTDTIELNKEKKFNFTSKFKFSEDDFEWMNLLGSGAYAKVYKARNKKTGEIYAIKIIDKIMIEKKGKLHQIFCENEFLNILDHPNIVKTYGVYEDEEKINIVLEYIPKGSLNSFITKTSNNNLYIFSIQKLFNKIEIVNFYGFKILPKINKINIFLISLHFN